MLVPLFKSFPRDVPHLISRFQRQNAVCFLKKRGLNVLALLPTWKDERNARLEKSVQSDVHIIKAYNPVGSKGDSAMDSEFDFIKYTQHCEEMVHRNNIDLILSFRDPSSLVHAALCDKFPHIPGPGFLSTFLTYNKYLTRKFLDPDPNPIKYTYLDVDNCSHDTLVKALQYVGVPAFIKPCTGTASFGVAKVTSLGDLARQMGMYKTVSTKWLPPYLDGKIDPQQYPEAFQNGALLEEYVDAAATIGVDGLIANDEIIQWPTQDVVYWKTRPSCPMGFIMPSILDKDILENVNQRYKEIAERMVHYGYNNNFLAVEFFILKTGQCKVMEITSRMFSTCMDMYRQCFQNGDPICALTDLAKGETVKSPTTNGLYGMYSLITTNKSGKMEDLLDLSDPELGNIVRPWYYRNDNVPPPYGEEGMTIATVDLTAPTYSGVFDRYHEVIRKVMRLPGDSKQDGPKDLCR